MREERVIEVPLAVRKERHYSGKPSASCVQPEQENEKTEEINRGLDSYLALGTKPRAE